MDDECTSMDGIVVVDLMVDLSGVVGVVAAVVVVVVIVVFLRSAGRSGGCTCCICCCESSRRERAEVSWDTLLLFIVESKSIEEEKECVSRGEGDQN